MENALNLNLSPAQAIVILGLQVWIFIIFPLIVIRKLNYLTRLVESQFEQEDPKEASS